MPHPKPQAKRGRAVARKRVAKRVATMARILRLDPHGPRRN